MSNQVLFKYNIHNTIYNILFPILAFLLPFGLYVKTLAPTYIPVDSAEFALCMHTWGVCHPPGFPLYVFLGKIFTSVLPIGTLIYKANLFSALFGAGTILLVYLALAELKVKRLFALIISLILAVSSAFWEYSVASDVFTFATFLLALTFFLTFKKRQLLAFFALGLSASHFYISAILFPLIVWFFYKKDSDRRVRFKLIASGFLLFALGFFPQILMFWRMQASPEINWGHAQGLGGFVDFVRREEFGNIFLIANPVLKFSIINFFRHLWSYFASLLTGFGVILPVLVLACLFFKGTIKNKNYILLLLSFLVLVIVQLFLLSTINPASADSPFQINKFYLSTFIPAVLLMGIAIQKMIEKIFEDDNIYPSLFLLVFLLVYLFSNFRANDLSKNYFSRDLVLDAMEQLPDNSVAIVVSHVFNFGSRYEQLINNRFTDKTILYFPNENNRDNEYYYPELFSKKTDEDFLGKVAKDKQLGKAESYILLQIAGNLDKNVYILQGNFEEKFFSYLKPYIRPYGLWWRVETEIRAEDNLDEAKGLFNDLRNNSVKFDDLENRQQQQLDSLNYAVSYHSTAILFAKHGRYDEAIEFLDRSYQVRPTQENIQDELKLVERTKELDSKFSRLVGEQDKTSLEEFGNNLFILGNYPRCAEVYGEIVRLNSSDAQALNNLASCYASAGQVEQARVNYQKALELDPNLDKARKGLEALEN